MFTVVAIAFVGADAAVCTFENRPNETDKRYSAVVKGKRVFGSPAQENRIFFEAEPALNVSYACFVGLYWGVCSAALAILLTKTIPQFGWKLNRPNLCGGLVAVGSFFMGADYLQELSLQFFIFENDLDFYKMDKVDIFDDLGWLCYFWALEIFTVLWVNIARAEDCGQWTKSIRLVVGLITVSATALFGTFIALSIGLLVEDTVHSDLSAVDTGSERFESMPKWHVDASDIVGKIASGWGIVVLILNTVVAVLMNISVRPRLQRDKDFGTGNAFAKITHINFYQQMFFNTCMAGALVCMFVYMDNADRVVWMPALWCFCGMALSWGAEFVVIFAYTVDQKNGKPDATADPLKMFDAQPRVSDVIQVQM